MKRRSPNKSEIAIEAVICFSFNNVSEYLSSLETEEKREMIRESRAETPEVRAEIKERQEILRKKAEDQMVQKKAEK